jgi:hypothetical protein
MKCHDCDPQATAQRSLTTDTAAIEAGVARLNALVCERCGQLLAPGDSMDALLRQLETLARFGLTSDGPPLLVSSAEER